MTTDNPDTNRRIVEAIEALRNSVIEMCDICPDDDGSLVVIIVYDDYPTSFTRFYGDSFLECLEKAVAARKATP